MGGVGYQTGREMVVPCPFQLASWAYRFHGVSLINFKLMDNHPAAFEMTPPFLFSLLSLRLDVRFLARLFGQDKPNLTDKKMNGNFTSIGGKAGVM